jgi:hypothetical protein
MVVGGVMGAWLEIAIVRKFTIELDAPVRCVIIHLSE